MAAVVTLWERCNFDVHVDVVDYSVVDVDADFVDYFNVDVDVNILSRFLRASGGARCLRRL